MIIMTGAGLHKAQDSAHRQCCPRKVIFLSLWCQLIQGPIFYCTLFLLGIMMEEQRSISQAVRCPMALIGTLLMGCFRGDGEATQVKAPPNSDLPASYLEGLV